MTACPVSSPRTGAQRHTDGAIQADPTRAAGSPHPRSAVRALREAAKGSREGLAGDSRSAFRGSHSEGYGEGCGDRSPDDRVSEQIEEHALGIARESQRAPLVVQRGFRNEQRVVATDVMVAS